ncbi:hypothetical protein INT44_002542 [Umbelopsis vinacea]|uniref:non-specific serine/threonine protein kinase n=1 Tax=Umbelopsis vinacea TaxID=44442 RepID=A0A8H7PEL5_9FUNG|nr:hypothetical protein INT44_002542 [Umbelopsis vinacea]
MGFDRFELTYADYYDTIVGQYRIKEPIGSGAYGCVFKAVHVFYGTWHALKCIPKEKETRYQHIKEVNFHTRLSRHPHIVTLEKVIETATEIWLALELGQCDLFSWITDKRSFALSEQCIRKMFLQIIDAVSYCHSQGIAHRDIKPENILIYDNGTTCKLADFGLATSEEQTDEFGCGSSFYLSPECQGSFNTKSYATKPNDIWSLGIILINLIVGRNPWKQANARDQTFVAFLKKPDFLKTVLPISDEVNDILLGIFKLDPTLRLNIQELRNKIIGCNQFKRPASQLSKKAAPARPSIATVANVNQSVSATRCSSIRSDDSWSSCYSDFSGDIDGSPSDLANNGKLVDADTNVTHGSTKNSSLVDGPLRKDSLGPSLNTVCSVASSASDGSECCTPETQLKNLLWNHTTIQKYVDTVSDDERVKDIYSDTTSAYCCPP